MALVGFGFAIDAQTVQGLIAGRVSDSRTGAAIAEATVSFSHSSTNFSGQVAVSPDGYYALVLLPPGEYQLRVEANLYQAQEIQKLELPVAGRLDIDFRLRLRSDVFEAAKSRAGTLPAPEDLAVTLFGPDLDQAKSSTASPPRSFPGRLEATLSDVMDPRRLRELPLAGRDVYSLLVTQPAVASDAGTSRGLGLSVNGQRASSSNFLLDGVENNDTLTTGPSTGPVPEFMQEYRVSTNNFSAEFGRTSGYVANAVTRAGGNSWHGLGYFNLKNEAFNANTFQRNAGGRSRLPLKELQGGGQVGGPLVRNRLFGSLAMERLRFRGDTTEEEYLLPTDIFDTFTEATSIAERLFHQFPAVARPQSRVLPILPVSLRPPVGLDRWTGMGRIDWVAGVHRVGARYALTDLTNPFFIWTPYPDFVSTLAQRTQNLALRLESMLAPGRANEFRFSWTGSSLAWDRPHPEIPTLLDQNSHTTLPGSFALYAYENRAAMLELGDSFLMVRDRHLAKFGGGFFWRNPNGVLTAGRDGMFAFADLLDYTVDKPSSLLVGLSRQSLPQFQIPDYRRQWKQSQFYLYAQDTWRITRSLVANYGVRYDSLGAPVTSGDTLVRLGAGSSFTERIAGAALDFAGPGTPVYAADRNDVQARAGLTWSPGSSGRWLLRGAYGIFQDRPFDNLWQNIRNNAIVLPTLAIDAPEFGGYNYLAPIASQLAGLQGQRFAGTFPSLTLIDPGLRNGYVQTFFAGGQWIPKSSLTVEMNGSGSLGRKLITTDIVNRGFRDNPALPEIAWRSSQGSSNYYALQTVARYRHRHGYAQGSYTWSHAIDNQSEPLQGDFFDLRFTELVTRVTDRPHARFAIPYGSSFDRGNADFDQRHNLVFLSLWEWRGFRLSQIAAFRSGFPYTVTTGSFNRADLIANPYLSAPVDGGERLLDPTAFREPAGALGNTGRNAFRGPGLWNIDLSIAKTLAYRERWRFTLRADAYNVFNHANLNNPQSALGLDDFGIALYGRRSKDAAFPGLAPFTETPRIVQLMLRVEF